MPGRPSRVCLVFSCSRPAIIIEPPEGSSTLVSARRTLSAGMLRDVLVAALETVNAPVLVSSETSVEIFREMRPWDITRGVKPSPRRRA
jgi:hypothetical protein